MTENQREEHAKKRVLIVMAHPDDGEFMCGATVAKWAAAGMDITYCLVTDGQVGDAGDETITSEELTKVRQRRRKPPRTRSVSSIRWSSCTTWTRASNPLSRYGATLRESSGRYGLIS